MTRIFERIDKLPDWAQPIKRVKGKYIDIALMHETPRRLCALASRMSHESWAKSTEQSDTELLNRLISMGDDHGKSVRAHQFFLIIEAPRYWWAECDTYTVGALSLGSTSTMFKEARRLTGEELVRVKSNIPEGLLQMRAKQYSEPTLARMADRRCDHRLPEWEEFATFARQCLSISNPTYLHAIENQAEESVAEVQKE